MGKRWCIYSAFFLVSFLGFSNSLYVDSLNSGSGNEIDLSKWNNEGEPSGYSQELSLKDSEEPKTTLVEKPGNEKSEGNTKWLSVYSFDKLYNLTEKDRGPQNETKLIFINTEDHIKIYENEDDDEDEDNIDTQLHEANKNIFNLLSPEGLLSQINYEGQANGLERTKRQAENGKKRCRCRRKGRRNMVRRRRRRRRRRNRVGQQQRPARRRRRRRGRRRNQRRGRRRCVCRKKEEGEGEGKSDGEEPEVEEADGEDEGTATEGTEEDATEEAEADDEDDDDEKEKEDDDDDDDDDEEEDDEDEDEEEEEDDDDENSSDEKGKELKSPEGMPSLGGIPAYIVPFPNIMETPNTVIPARGYPVGNIPARAAPMYKFSPHSTGGPLPLRKSISNKEN